MWKEFRFFGEIGGIGEKRRRGCRKSCMWGALVPRRTAPLVKGGAAQPQGGLVFGGYWEETRGTIPPSRLRRATSLYTRPADAAHAERQLGAAHLTGVFVQILIYCPFHTQRAAEDCVGIFLGASREKIRLRPRGSPRRLSGSPSPSSCRPLRGTRASTHARCQLRSAPSASGF